VELETLSVLQSMVSNAMQLAINLSTEGMVELKRGVSYAEVSYNTFIKFREMGLK